MSGLRKILVAVAGAAVCCVMACGVRHHVTASAERLRQHRTERHIRSRRHQCPAASSPSFGSRPGKTLTETLTKTLTDSIFRITAGAGGEIGVAVIAGGDTVAVNDSCVYPLMSVFKVHQALAVCERLDREGSTLDTLLTFRRSDLDPATWSPMMKDHPEPALTMPVASLLRYSLVQSDNNASNVLFSRLVDVHETDSFIATLIPRARFRITYAESEMSADHAKAYGNRTSPLGAAMLMDRLFTGSIVSREKQDFITECLYGCATGEDRISAPLLGMDGVTIAHKTGSGYTDDGILAACNDVAFIQLPGGMHYTLTIFIKDFPGDERQAAQIMSQLSATVFRLLSRNLCPPSA